MSEQEQNVPGNGNGTAARKSSSTSRKKASTSRRKSGTANRKTASRKSGTAGRKKTSAARKTSTRERKTQPLSAALIARVKKLSKGGKTLQEIADSLNKSKETTSRGLPWTTQNVWHVLRRK